VKGRCVCKQLDGYTFEDFLISFHKDKDYNTYSYEIWAPSVLKTDELTTMSNDNDIIREGEKNCYTHIQNQCAFQ